MTGSCELLQLPQPACLEYEDASTNEVLDDAEASCADFSGSWHDDACPRATAIGGCSAVITGPKGNVTQIDWYYPGGSLVTIEDVMARCDASGKTFVAP